MAEVRRIPPIYDGYRKARARPGAGYPAGVEGNGRRQNVIGAVFRAKPAISPPVLALPLETAMSPVTRALHQRFEEVCQSELQRLRRKTASLSPADRAEVDAMTLEVAHAIAARMEAALDRDPHGGLDRVVARLFAVGDRGDLAAT